MVRDITCSERRPAGYRRGFTLIELLIAIAVILLLMGLTLRGINGALSNARRASTQSLITRVNSLLKARIGAVEQLVTSRANPKRMFDPIPGLTPTQSAVGYVGNASRNREAAILVRKGVAKFYLPQTWQEVIDAGLHTEAGVATVPIYPTTPPASYPTTPPTGRKALLSAAEYAPAVESSEVLYFVLTKSSVPGYDQVGTDAFSASEVSDTNGNGFPEFVDSWGKPLRFYRWPTRLVKPAGDDGDDTVHTEINLALAGLAFRSLPPVAAPLNGDFDDPTALLTVLADMSTPPFTRAEFEEDFHTMATYSVPLIVSVGLDGELGLGEPNGAPWDSGGASIRPFARLAQPLSDTDFTTIQDNITNHNIVAGGS